MYVLITIATLSFEPWIIGVVVGVLAVVMVSVVVFVTIIGCLVKRWVNPDRKYSAIMLTLL